MFSFLWLGFENASNTTPVKTTFVPELASHAQNKAIDFLSTGITSYWLVILSVLFVGFMIGLFWWLARKLFGSKRY